MRSVAAASCLAVLAFIALPALGAARSAPIDGCRPVVARHLPSDERSIEIDTPDGVIRGTLAGPQGVAPRALALLLHGYTGSRNEIPLASGEGMFAKTARAFATQGIATLRIDFIGSGLSDGDWAGTLFSTQARDAVRAARALQAEHVDKNLALGVLGYSQGGLIALRAAAAFDRIALWNPVIDPMATYSVIFGRDTILVAAQASAADETRFVIQETRLRPAFFAELIEASPMDDAARTAAPVLVVTGRRDPLVAGGAALAERMREKRKAETVIFDVDAGHDLGAVHEPALLDDVIACTAGFLLDSAAR
ncbi:alpha/beta hydrolase family protein [Rubrimonas cliftonensis]|uniref:Serine aminopeptidase S33 domain-containing protein n=1 Tax=Rubrimonas cliftonensis TaxID=89524 RepID=A0A1H4G5D8_9RHOB|nr:alpha/beta fold hydrolase [Rubrimonas cliftonensis]SEB04501.1 hypothetical protein SAMN05444370_13712 [Rubrimonas cliftonensis]